MTAIYNFGIVHIYLLSAGKVTAITNKTINALVYCARLCHKIEWISKPPFIEYVDG